MIIRKKFKFEGAHIVRNCSSNRCKRSIHGHSYIVEVFLTARGLDNGQMILDFGLLKGTVKDFLDSFDHSYSFWNKEDEKFINFIKENSARWVSMPVSPTAESYSLMFLFVIDKILEATKFNNNELVVKVSSVRVHETETGYAESFRDDLKWVNFDLDDIIFSEQVKKEWVDYNMFEKLKKFHIYYNSPEPFVNPEVTQQIK